MQSCRAHSVSQEISSSRSPTQRFWLAYLVAAALSLSMSTRNLAAEANAKLLAQIEPRITASSGTDEFKPRGFSATWLKDGSGYLKMEEPNGADPREIARYDAASGERSVIAGKTLVAPGTSERLRIDGFICSPTGERLLLHTVEVGGITRWIYDRESKDLQPVKVDAGVTFDKNAFSPDERRLLGSSGPELVVIDIANGRTTQLTQDSVALWLEYGFATWSPDSKKIAYARFDYSAVPKRAVLVPGDPTYRTFRETPFERIGGPLATQRVGVISADGGDTRWVELADKLGTFMINGLGWAGNSDEVFIDKLSRSRDVREVLVANPETGAITKAYSATDPAWVVSLVDMDAGEFGWVGGSKNFILFSERDGWRRAYVVSKEGGEPKPITAAGSDVIKTGRIDEKNGWFYYYASPTDATQSYLFRARLDGTGTPERLTPQDQPGTHEYVFSPDSRWAFHTYSTFDKPPVTDLVELPGHKTIRVLEDNAALAAKVKPLITRPTEFLKLDIGGGVVMDGWMIKPRDFDPTKKYPVFVHVYGEPAGQTVLDDWYGGSGFSLFHRAVADLGYLVVSMDNRGTPGPKGAAWRKKVYGSLGPLSTDEQAAGLKALEKLHSFVDLSRVGIWGWSGGGSNTLNALFRKPDTYHVGIAVVPKPQAQYYHAWYQEIFMRTPEVNPEGYRTGSAINYAEGLRGDLLIITGSGETNTHIEIIEGLVDRLIALGKRFDYFVYPNRDHGLSEGEGTKVHVRMQVARYLVEHLPAGPR
jgi:dipeptidyl-peptidase 4